MGCVSRNPIIENKNKNEREREREREKRKGLIFSFTYCTKQRITLTKGL